MNKIELRKIGNGRYISDHDGIIRVEDITGAEGALGQIRHDEGKWAVSQDGELIGFAYALKDVKVLGVQASLKRATQEDVADDCAPCRWYDGDLCQHPMKQKVGFWSLPIENCFSHKRPEKRVRKPK